MGYLFIATKAFSRIWNCW